MASRFAINDAGLRPEERPLLSFPPFRLDIVDERLWADQSELTLRRKPFAILRYLALHPRRLVTHKELTAAVWGKATRSESLLRTHIREVRSVLGQPVIETVPGRGYRFLLDVHETDLRHGVPGGADSGLWLARSVVGRHAELEALQGNLQAARGCQRQMIFVTGEAGIGKTALVDRLLGGPELSGAVAARGFCVERYGPGEAYLPVLGALGTLCRGPRGGEVVEVLARHAPTWVTQMPGLLDDEQLPSFQLRAQGASQARMLRELADALEVLSNTQLVILVLEDLQWADNSTTELLAFLAQRREPARLAVIGTSRPAEAGGAGTLRTVVGELTAHRLASTVALAPLSPAAVAEYLESRWPGHGVSGLAAAVHGATGGNPLFMVALLDDLENRAMVQRVGGEWRLSVGIGEIGAHRTESVRQFIDLQIGRLSASEQRVLEAAGVAGAEFDVDVVACALQVDAAQVEADCERLAQQGRFLRRAGRELSPTGELLSRFAFVHDLYVHAARSRSSSVTARVLHRRVAERLEERYGVAAKTIAAELASHFDASESYGKAVEYYDKAGMRAFRRSGGAEAARHFERARELLAHLPNSRERDELELTILRRLGRATIAANGLQGPQLVPSFMRSAELARRVGDTESLASALLGLQQCRMLRCALRELEAHVAELGDVVRHISDPAAARWATLMASAGALHQGRLLDAHRGLTECVAAAEAGTDSKEVIDGPSFHFAPLLFSNLALADWLIGRPDAALASALKSIAHAEALEDPFTIGLALAAAATVHIWRREPKAALEFAGRGLNVAASAGSGLGMTRTLAAAQVASVELGQTPPDAALQALETSLLTKAPSHRGGRSYLALFVAEVAASAGQVDRALSEISEALRFAEEVDERAWESELHRLRGELIGAADREAAERSFTAALEIARRQGSRSYELRAAMSLHRIQRGARRKSALEAVRRAYGAFTEGFATRDLVQAKALLERG